MNKITKLSIPLLITLLALTLTISLASAATTGLWSYGDGTYDMAVCNIGTSDGGYAVIGATTSYGLGAEDIWLIKTDSEGNAAIPVENTELVPLWMVGVIIAIIIVVLLVVVVLLKRKPKPALAEQPQTTTP